MEGLLEKKSLISLEKVFESRPQRELQTIAEIVDFRAETEPKKEAFTYLLDGEEEAISWNYLELKLAVSAASSQIQNLTQAGDRVLLLFEPGLSFIAAYLAAISSGAIAVPCHPPIGSRQVGRLLKIIQDCQPTLILQSETISSNAPVLLQFQAIAGKMGIQIEQMNVDTSGPDVLWSRPRLGAHDIAMLQYTSASTGDPKGVMATQGNLVKNCEAIYQWLGKYPQRKGCIWLPPYHDMGLLGGIMQPLYAGFPLVFMSPMHFVQSPLRWLKALSNYRLTTTGAPNFALNLCVNEITDEALIEAEIDLSCVREIFCGSEPINPATIAAFEKRFQEYGLPINAVNPCYGLAEATLFVSGKESGTQPHSECFEAKQLDQGVAVTGNESDCDREIMSCGLPGKDLDVRIVDPETRVQLTEGQVGEIWISGPSITRGYWGNDVLTHQAFGNQLPETNESYYRTGDLGFFWQNQLYVAGRIKEVVIIRGRNLFPQDIERCALSALPENEASIAAAFSLPGKETEQLVVVVALRRKPTDREQEKYLERVSAAIANEFNVVPGHIHIGPGKTIPRTTSGKIRRVACREHYLKGKLPSFENAGGAV